MSQGHQGYDAEVVREKLDLYVGTSRQIRGRDQLLRRPIIRLLCDVHGEHVVFM
jgi:hypothetical protein